MMLARIMFAYLALFQLVLLGVSFFMNQDESQAITLTPTLLGLLAGAFAAFAAGLFLPQRVTSKVRAPGSGTNHPLSAVITPYMMRLCLFETCSVLGFVAGFLHHSWYVMVPFVVLGLTGTSLSAPTEATFEKLRNG